MREKIKKKTSFHLGVVRGDLDLCLLRHEQRQRRPRRAPHRGRADPHGQRRRQRAGHERPPPRRRGRHGGGQRGEGLVVARAEPEVEARSRLFRARDDEAPSRRVVRVGEGDGRRRERDQGLRGGGRRGGGSLLEGLVLLVSWRWRSKRSSGRRRGRSGGGGGGGGARKAGDRGGRRREPARRQAALRRRRESRSSSSCCRCCLDGEQRRSKLLLLPLFFFFFFFFDRRRCRRRRRFGSRRGGGGERRGGLFRAAEPALLVGAATQASCCRRSRSRRCFPSVAVRRPAAALASVAGRRGGGRALGARGRHLFLPFFFFGCGECSFFVSSLTACVRTGVGEGRGGEREEAFSRKRVSGQKEREEREREGRFFFLRWCLREGEQASERPLVPPPPLSVALAMMKATSIRVAWAL